MKAIGIGIVVALTAVLLACGGGKDEFYQDQVDLSGQPPQVAYVALKCAKCHGPAREGQRTAPSLVGLSNRWSEDDLVAYLRNPKAVQAAIPRLAYMAERFPIEMPAYQHTDEQVLRGLIGWLLAR